MSFHALFIMNRSTSTPFEGYVLRPFKNKCTKLFSYKTSLRDLMVCNNIKVGSVAHKYRKFWVTLISVSAFLALRRQHLKVSKIW